MILVFQSCTTVLRSDYIVSENRKTVFFIVDTRTTLSSILGVKIVVSSCLLCKKKNINIPLITARIKFLGKSLFLSPCLLFVQVHQRDKERFKFDLQTKSVSFNRKIYARMFERPLIAFKFQRKKSVCFFAKVVESYESDLERNLHIGTNDELSRLVLWWQANCVILFSWPFITFIAVPFQSII